MKSSLKTYLVVWVIAVLAFFGIICSIGGRGLDVFNDPRSSLYLFALATMVVQLVVGIVVFGRGKGSGSSSDGFYGIPLGYFSTLMTILTLLLSIFFVVRIDIPAWVGMIALIIVLAIDLSVSLALGSFSHHASRADEQTQQETSLFLVLRARAEALASRQADPAAIASARRVSEALRFSDPVSSPVIATADNSVREAYESYEAAFAAASGCPDEQGLRELQRAESLLASRLSERNALCRLNKNR